MSYYNLTEVDFKLINNNIILLNDLIFSSFKQETSVKLMVQHRRNNIEYINKHIFGDEISEGFKLWKDYGAIKKGDYMQGDHDLLCICGNEIQNFYKIERDNYECILGLSCAQKFDEEYGTTHVKDFKERQKKEKKEKQTCICGGKKTIEELKCKICIKNDELIKQQELKKIEREQREERQRVEREKREEQLRLESIEHIRLQEEEQIRLSKICPQCSGCKPINNFKYCFKCNEKNKLLKTKKCIKCNIPKKDDKYNKCFKCNEEEKINLDF